MATPAAILSVLVQANTGKATRDLARFNAQLTATETTGSRVGKTLGTIGKVGLVGAAGGFAYAVKKAADFEQQLDSLGSVADATGREMDRFRKQAMKAGADTKFSALEAAEAQTELAKGGLKVRQILRGGLNSALSLAAAGEMELAEAAETTANAMKLFGIEGKDSVQVADALAQAANQTTADVKDFADALKQGGSVARLAGLDLQETVSILESLADAGIRGSDAGTSMKAFFLNIATPSVKAQKAMKELGVSIFDSQGQLKELPALSRNLRQAFGNLTKEQFLNKAGTIAGSDAIRTLWALYDAGPDKMRKYDDGLRKQGTAARVAAEKQDNLKGKLENLQGSIETIAISIGTKFLPKLTDLAEKVTDILNNPKLTSAEKLNKLTKIFSKVASDALTAVIDMAAKAAPKAAEAFVKGWLNAGIWARLLVGGWLLQKFGLLSAFTKLGKQGGTAMAAGTGGGFKGALPGIFRKLGIATILAAVLLPEIKKAGESVTKKLGGAELPSFGNLGNVLARQVSKGFDLSKLTTGPEILLGFATGGPGGAMAEISEAADLGDEKLRKWGEAADDAFRKFRKARDTAGMGQVVDTVRTMARTLDGPAKQAFLNWANAAGRLTKVTTQINKVRDSIDRLGTHGSRSIKELQQGVSFNMKLIGDAFGKHSKRGKDAMQRNLQAARANIHQMMSDGTITTKQGMRLIEQYMVKSLQLMGFSKKDALSVRKGQDPYTGKSIDAKQNLTNKQRGGLIPGTGHGDKVHVMAEPGEGFINKRAVRAMGGPSAIDAINRAVPRFQSGGMVRVPGDPDTTGGRDLVNPSIVNEVASWIKRFKIQIGYAFDPGHHQSPGHNVTGTALDVIPGIGGSWDTLEAGIKAAVAAGKTVYYGTNGIGTPLANHGRGNHAHVEWGGGGAVPGGVAALEQARMLQRLAVVGPESLLKANVQGALDVGVGGANAALRRANRQFASGGSSSYGGISSDFSGPWTKAMAQIAESNNWSLGDWQELVRRESGGDPTAVNPSSGAFGLGQFLGSTLEAYRKYGAASTDPVLQIQAMARYISDRYGTPSKALSFHDANNWYKRGGIVGYVGDSLGVGTVPKLRGKIDAPIAANVLGGRSSASGVSALKGMNHKKFAQYVFDLGSNDSNAGQVRSSLHAFDRIAGSKPVHAFTLLGKNAKQKNQALTGHGANVNLLRWAGNAKGMLQPDGLHATDAGYNKRARLAAKSIKAHWGKANKPKDKVKVKHRDFKSGVLPPTLKQFDKTLQTLWTGNPQQRSDALHGFLDRAKQTGLPKSLTGKITDATDSVATLADFADRAGQLTTEDAQGNVVAGVSHGQTEVYWLNEELKKLFSLRNMLAKAQRMMEKRREMIAALIARARAKLRETEKRVADYAKHIAHYEDLLKRAKKHPKKNKEGIKNIERILRVGRANKKGHEQQRDGLKRMIPILTGSRGRLAGDSSEFQSTLDTVQGPGGGMAHWATLPGIANTSGDIFSTQLRLQELNAKVDVPSEPRDTSISDQLLREANLRTLVSERQRAVLQGLPAFGGSFATGGTVPGPMGAPRTVIAHGGETISPPGEAAVHISFAGGMEWLAQFVDVRVNGQTRKATQRRPLPGKGGGGLR